MSETTRRNVLAGAAGVGAAAVLAACGSNGSDTGSSAGSENNGGQAAPTAGQQQPGSGALAKKSEIPVGGGKVIAAQGIVVTQPVAGEFKAFSAKCTHQGCMVGSVANGTINCPCHGSKFSAADGSVKGGPASSALAAKNVTVQGDDIVLA
jgi:Rieske Fe-S protein